MCVCVCVCVGGCADIDECSINADLCAHGQCLNYPGGYHCECDMGFTSADNERNCVGTYRIMVYVCLSVRLSVTADDIVLSVSMIQCNLHTTNGDGQL